MKSMNEAGYGNLLRQTRKSMGLTIEEMSERLDVSVNSLSLWEREKAYPDAIHRMVIKSVLGIDIPERNIQ